MCSPDITSHTFTVLSYSYQIRFNKNLEVYYSSDKAQIVSCSENNIGMVWDAVSEELTKNLQGQFSGMKSVCYNSDGKRTVSGSWNKAVKVFVRRPYQDSKMSL